MSSLATTKLFLACLLCVTAAGLLLTTSVPALETGYWQEQEQYSFVTQWGSEGSGIGKFKQPLEISVDSNNNVYVTDWTGLSNKVQKFTDNGTFLTSWGTLGFGPGLFTSPGGIDFDSSGNVYVADFGSPDTAVQKFTNNGTFLQMWGSFGLGDGQFNRPLGISLDSEGNVYVVDTGNYRIQVFTPS